MLTLLCLFSLALQAEMVRDLYEVTLPVDKQSDSALRRAASEGLETVLVRVSGRQQLRDNAVVAPALSQAQRYLRQYRYELVETPAENGLSAPQTQRLLHMSFSGAQIQQLLQQAQLPVWSSNRPRILVWLVVDDYSGRRFATPDSHPQLFEALQQQARRRGLIFSYPLLDLQDSLNLNPDQLWRLDRGAIARAVERYRVDHYLVGRLSLLSSGWLASWSFVSDQHELALDARESNAEAVLRPAVDLAADRLAQKFAVVASADGRYGANIHVSGIRGFSDYARIITYLEKNAVIEHANPVWLSGTEAVVNLVLKDSLDKVEQFFALDRKLVATEPPARLLRSSPVESVLQAVMGDGEDVVAEGTPGEVGVAASAGGVNGGEGIGVATNNNVDSGAETVAPKEAVPPMELHGYYRWRG